MPDNWKCGFEIELLAPKGKSRADLANALAEKVNGRVVRGFYPQSEPSLAPGVPVFENLILSFEVLDSAGKRIALCVDDLTIKFQLDRNARPKPGWLRILSDDARLLSLVRRQCSALEPIETVLQPIANLFGTEIESEKDGVSKVLDRNRHPIAIAAHLPGERERPCEIITAPLTHDRGHVLDLLLQTARDLDFFVPTEAAVHVHFDAAPLCSGRVLSRLIAVLNAHSSALRTHVKTNPNCVRLGPLKPEILALAQSDVFKSTDWEKARSMLLAAVPSKYCDFNFQNIARQLPDKHTFEVRIFPGSMDSTQIQGFADLFTRILRWATDPAEPPMPADASVFF